MKALFGFLILILSMVVINDQQQACAFTSPLSSFFHINNANNNNQQNKALDLSESDQDLKQSLKDFNTLIDELQLFNQLNVSMLLHSRASMFQIKRQTNPDFLLKINFSPQYLSIRLLPPPFHPVKIKPWFLQASSANNSRLSSWKDGNSLYAAKIIYS